MTTLVKIRDLSVRYPSGRQALRNLSLSLRPGESIGIVGESGCGKTTLALALMGMLEDGCQVSGRIEVDGRVVAAQPGTGRLRGRGRCAMLFQNPQGALNPVVRVGKQIRRVLRRQGLGRTEAENRLERLLQQVELPLECRRAWPHELSGGMQQRILLAMALARDARLLIADEPTAALDSRTRSQILDLLTRLQTERRLAIMLISHDLAAIARVCDQVLVLYRGRIVEQAPRPLLFSQPRHPYTTGLLATIPKVRRQRPRRLLTIAGDANDTGPETGCAFAPRCPRREDFCQSNLPPLNRHLDDRHRFACFNPREPDANG